MHHAAGQQRRRVKAACDIEIARSSPGPARRIVKFCARRFDKDAKSPLQEQKRPADRAGLSHGSLSEVNGLGSCRAV
jgi:hypothetical protein